MNTLSRKFLVVAGAGRLAAGSFFVLLLAGCNSIGVGFSVPIGPVSVGVGGSIPLPRRAEPAASAPEPAASAPAPSASDPSSR